MFPRFPMAMLLTWLMYSQISLAAEPVLEIAPFVADITPEIGLGPCVGFMKDVSRIEAPLEARGVVIRFGKTIHVLCALDSCGLCTSSDIFLRNTVAEAVGTVPDHVAAQSLHQHSAPALDTDAARMLYGEDSDHFRSHEAYQTKIVTSIAAAAKASLEKLTPVTSLIASRAIVDRVASNRRIPQADGSLLTRLSSTKDPILQDVPEGLVDPWVRTLTFFSGDKPLMQLHYYATHPQTIYGGGRIGWDVPGMARSKLQQQTGVFQVYFTGCGGNIAMGKYNNATEEARAGLAERLFEGMQRSAQLGLDPAAKPDDRRQRDKSITLTADTPMDWMVEPISFQERTDGEFAYERNVAIAADKKGQLSPRIKAAMFVPWTDRLRAGYQVPVTRLKIGSIQIVHLPGEPFVEYQLFAQQAAPQSFVCVAGYGDVAVQYYGPDSIYADRGGYEQTWCFTAPCQKRVEAVLTKILDAKTASR